MYTTCLYCNSQFEKNESLEAFPVGRRLAFDAAKGRLWVVCRKCERWCLSPLDERWEAIEQAERLYRDTRRRVATDNIGLAKVAEGTTLVRIGAPLRPEFAAWRYGDQFGRRRRRQMLITGGGVAALGALALGGAAAGISVGGFWTLFVNAGQIVASGAPGSIVARIRDTRQGIMVVRRRHLSETVLSRTIGGAMVLDVHHKGKREFFRGELSDVTRLEGAQAERAAAILLSKVNRFGANRREVSQAVADIEAAGSTERFIRSACTTAAVRTRPPAKKAWWQYKSSDDDPVGLFGLESEQRLGLEMALHEEAERRALEGELATLEKAWRDAEEIAGISDNLTVPESVDAALTELKTRQLSARSADSSGGPEPGATA